MEINDLAKLTLKAIYSAEGKKIEPGQYGLPADNAEFADHVNEALTLGIQGLLTECDYVTGSAGNIVSMTAKVTSAGVALAS